MLPEAFPVKIGLKQEDALSPLVSKIPLEYVIRKYRETVTNHEGIESRLNSANDWRHELQNLLIYILMSEDAKPRMCPQLLVFCGCEIRSATFKQTTQIKDAWEQGDEVSWAPEGSRNCVLKKTA